MIMTACKHSYTLHDRERKKIGKLLIDRLVFSYLLYNTLIGIFLARTYHPVFNRFDAARSSTRIWAIAIAR